LPIPSYARVTNLANNKSVVVRINDRGPFHPERLIDLSYTAAYRLGVLGGGKALVEVETIIPGASTPVPPTVAASPAVLSATPSPAGPAPGAPREEPALSAVLPQEPAAMQPEATITGEPRGVFLQLGAFGSQDNADSYLARVRAQIEWLAPALHVYPRDGLFRVHAGPYATHAEARVAADRIGQALGIKAIVFTR
jgi:rare lipoprotein A